MSEGQKGYRPKPMKKIIAEISGRHIHLSQADLFKLFGKNYKLKKLKDLSQPGEFASTAIVRVKGPKNILSRVRIVGPSRKNTQVELTVSDCRFLGINPVFRLSGDHKNSSGGLKLIGPKGSILLKTGVIVPLRHLHISVSDARKWHLKNGQKVRAKIPGIRGLVFDNIIVRIGNFETRVHLDTDEANAAGLLSCSKIDLDI